MTLPQRNIRSLTVGALGLGCMGMSNVYGRPDAAEATATLHRALELGVTLLDTADFYGAGHNESFLGQALRGRRDDYVLATKFGILAVPKLGLPRGVSARPERVRHCVDASLRRLGTDVIDLYYLHRLDPKVPIEETVGAMAEQVRAGKVRELGLSEVSGSTLRRAYAVHPIAALQTEWSLFSREIETDPLPVARELGVTIVPYSPLGRGMLTGNPAAITDLPLFDYRRFLPRWRRANREQNLATVGRIEELAEGLGITAGQLALAWLLGQGDDVVPIPGTKRRRWLEENVAAVGVQIPADVRAELDTLHAAGGRYGGATAAMVDDGGPRGSGTSSAGAFQRANRLMRPVLTNPVVQRLIRRPTCTVRYAGRRSGAERELTAWYQRTGNGVDIQVGMPERKTWWKNFRRPHALEIEIDGRRYAGTGAVEQRAGKTFVRVIFDRG